jgi:hypothetical protein
VFAANIGCQREAPDRRSEVGIGPLFAEPIACAGERRLQPLIPWIDEALRQTPNDEIAGAGDFAVAAWESLVFERNRQIGFDGRPL